MSENPHNMRTKIIEQMNRMKMSKSELSRKSGLSMSLIHTILGGDTKNPGIYTIAKIAKIIDCSVDELITNSVTKDSQIPIVLKNIILNEKHIKLFNIVVNFITTQKMDIITEKDKHPLQLFINVTDYITSNILKQEDIESIDLLTFLVSIYEIYEYSNKSNVSFVDKKFADWYILSKLKTLVIN